MFNRGGRPAHSLGAQRRIDEC